MNTAQPTPTDAPEPRSAALLRDVDSLRGRVNDAVKAMTSARKTLDALRKKGALESIPTLDKARSQLERSDLSMLGLEDERVALVGRLGEHLQGLRQRARHEVLGGLRELCQAEGQAFEVIGTEPPMVVMSPLTVELDPDQGKAVLLFARETVLEVGLSARAIFEGRKKAMAQIKASALPSEEFFDILRMAYRTVLMRDGLPPDERIDLVDLLAPLSVLSLSRDSWRRVDGSRLEGYPRYLLAYQLSRLRRDGCLQRNDARVELGTATGGSTRNKRNVLFVPVSPTDGQYYLTVRFSQGRTP